MLQREVIGQALARRRATHGNTPQFQRAQEFFQMVMERQDVCWDDLVREFRRNYSDATEETVAVLAETDDPLIIYNLLRVADMQDPREAEAVRKVVRDLDPQKHEVSVLAMTEVPQMRATIQKKERLPDSVRAALNPTEESDQPSKRSRRSRARRTTKKSTAGEQTG